MQTNHIIEIDPMELTVHPAAKRLPEWAIDDERFIALVEDIRERGIDQPLLIDPENRVLDGRERWKAAKQLQLKVVAVIIHQDDCLGVILKNLVTRKHFTKGALAYIAFPLLEPAHKEAQARKLEMLKKGPNSPKYSQDTTGKTVSDFAFNLGFSRNLFFQAKWVHDAFAESDRAIAAFELEHPDATMAAPGRPEDLRARFEPRILSMNLPNEDGFGPKWMGLGAVKAGIEGLRSTKGTERVDSEQLELFEDLWTMATHRYSYWEKFSEIEKGKAMVAIRKSVAAMPVEMREFLGKALKQANASAE